MTERWRGNCHTCQVDKWCCYNSITLMEITILFNYLIEAENSKNFIDLVFGTLSLSMRGIKLYYNKISTIVGEKIPPKVVV